jgi:hypothetical protein
MLCDAKMIISFPYTEFALNLKRTKRLQVGWALQLIVIWSYSGLKFTVGNMFFVFLLLFWGYPMATGKSDSSGNHNGIPMMIHRNPDAVYGCV